MNEINEFMEQAKAFEPTSAAQAMKQLEQAGTVVFVGRETCPFCRKFVKKLSKVTLENDFKVLYVHSERPVTEMDAIQKLRNQYGVKTVPGLLVATEDGVNVRCDSSMSEQEIIQMITGA